MDINRSIRQYGQDIGNAMVPSSYLPPYFYLAWPSFTEDIRSCFVLHELQLLWCDTDAPDKALERVLSFRRSAETILFRRLLFTSACSSPEKERNGMVEKRAMRTMTKPDVRDTRLAELLELAGQRIIALIKRAGVFVLMGSRIV